MVSSLQPVNFIRAWRDARGITIIELAEQAGIDKGNLSRIERRMASVSVAQLKRIRDVLGIHYGDLLRNSPEELRDRLDSWERATPDQRAQIRAVSDVITGYQPKRG